MGDGNGKRHRMTNGSDELHRQLPPRDALKEIGLGI